jgi:hypothetical protein
MAASTSIAPAVASSRRRVKPRPSVMGGLQRVVDQPAQGVEAGPDHQPGGDTDEGHAQQRFGELGDGLGPYRR